MQKHFWSRRITVALWTQLALLGCATAEAADQVFTDNVRIEKDFPSLRFQDTSNGTESWTIYGFGSNFDIGRFSSTVAGVPVRLSFNAPDYSLYIGENGIGLGMDFPLTNLHALSTNGPYTFRMEDSSGTPNTWDISGGGLGFDIKDVSAGTTPFSILPDAPTNSLLVATNGSVGLGTNLPNQLGAINGNGRFFNIRANGASAATGIANGAFQGQLGAQNHFVHLGAAANQRIMRLQTSSGFTGFHALNDNLTSYAVKSILMMNMTNGNVGFKRDAPAHPIHMASGAHVTAGGVWTNASSRTVKNNIRAITSEQARETVRALQPVGYQYNEEPDEDYVGFIAEDVPEMVATKDRKSLAPMDVVAVLTKVVQDQDRQLTDQSKQLAEERRRNETERERQQQLIDSLAKRLADLEAKLR